MYSFYVYIKLGSYNNGYQNFSELLYQKVIRCTVLRRTLIIKRYQRTFSNQLSHIIVVYNIIWNEFIVIRRQITSLTWHELLLKVLVSPYILNKFRIETLNTVLVKWKYISKHEIIIFLDKLCSYIIKF